MLSSTSLSMGSGHFPLDVAGAAVATISQALVACWTRALLRGQLVLVSSPILSGNMIKRIMNIGHRVRQGSCVAQLAYDDSLVAGRGYAAHQWP